MSWDELIKTIEELIEKFAPAIAVLFWDYEEKKVDEAKNEALDSKTILELEKNREKINEKYDGDSDLDIINEACASDGGPSGKSDKI